MESALKSVYFAFMNSIEIFQLALQLQEPWYVSSVCFNEGEEGGKELHIDIDFKKGFEFEPEAKVHDRTKREWRHLNFFVRGTPFGEYTCYLHCRVPRIKSPDGKVKTVAVPWASPIQRIPSERTPLEKRQRFYFTF